MYNVIKLEYKQGKRFASVRGEARTVKGLCRQPDRVESRTFIPRDNLNPFPLLYFFDFWVNIMSERPTLCKELDSKTLKSYYYLKEELVCFCRENNLSVSGSKTELTERIALFLDTGTVSASVQRKRVKSDIGTITEATEIEDNIVCSEKHRAFFKEKIGKSFSFNVVFQKWLKANSGKTYGDAINAYYRIMEEKKKSKTTIDKQFEYNNYIRDFFSDNKGRTLEDAIICWKYKKSLKGHNRYERTDLIALNKG